MSCQENRAMTYKFEDNIFFQTNYVNKFSFISFNINGFFERIMQINLVLFN